MKKYILFFTLILIFSNCEKLRVEDGLPILDFREVARNLAPTSVEFSAEVIESELSISDRGFCWSKNPMPTLNDSSIIGEDFYNQNSYFFTKISNLEPGTTYYFRVYATTVQGTGYSREVIVDIPKISIPDCEIEANKVVYNSSSINYNDVEINQYGDEFIIDADYYQLDLRIKFRGPPETGEYSTVSWSYVEDINTFFKCAVFIDFSVLGQSTRTYDAKFGETIYVEVLDNDVYKIEFCDLMMEYGSSTEDIVCSGHINASL